MPLTLVNDHLHMILLQVWARSFALNFVNVTKSFSITIVGKATSMFKSTIREVGVLHQSSSSIKIGINNFVGINELSIFCFHNVLFIQGQCVR